MAHIREKVKFYCQEKPLEVIALIDTGSTKVILPKRVAEELGVKALGEMEVELVDGTLRKMNYGVVEIEIMERRVPVIATLVEGGEVCLGVEALESLGLALDPITGKIYPSRRFVSRL